MPFQSAWCLINMIGRNVSTKCRLSIGKGCRYKKKMLDINLKVVRVTSSHKWLILCKKYVWFFNSKWNLFIVWEIRTKYTYKMLPLGPCSFFPNNSCFRKPASYTVFYARSLISANRTCRISLTTWDILGMFTETTTASIHLWLSGSTWLNYSLFRIPTV